MFERYRNWVMSFNSRTARAIGIFLSFILLLSLVSGLIVFVAWVLITTITDPIERSVAVFLTSVSIIIGLISWNVAE